jgi:NitT/TauT family transport system permease protein
MSRNNASEAWRRFTVRFTSTFPPVVVTLALVVVFLLAVEAVTRLGWVNPLFLRPPTEVFDLLVEEVGTESLRAAVLTTAYRIALTFVVSVLIASGFVALFYRYRSLREAYLPLLGALFGTPIVLLYLVFVVIFGRGTAAVVAISSIIGMIPLVVNSTDALLSVDQTYIDLCRSFNGSTAKLWRSVIIPAAAPGIFAGIRIGVSYMITVVVAVEFLLILDGLGALISNAYLKFDTNEMFAGITLIVILVVIAIFLLRQMEALIQR